MDRFKSLRIRLLALTLIAILPGFVLLIISAWEVRSHAQAEARERVSSTVDYGATEQARLIRRAERVLQEDLGPALRQGGPEACTSRARILLREEPDFINFGALSPVGDVICSALSLRTPVSLLDRPYVQQAIREKAFVAGGLGTSAFTDAPSGSFGWPLLAANGSVRAVLFAEQSTNWLREFARDNAIPDSSSIFVASPKGKILSRFPEHASWAESSLEDWPLMETIREQQQGLAFATDPDGIRRLYAFRPLDRVPEEAAAYIGLGLSYDHLFDATDSIFARNLLVLAAVSALALIGAWLLGGWLLVRPIGTLVQAAERLTSGDTSTRTGLNQSGEIGRLGRAFDEMAASLQQNTDRIRRSERMEAVGQLAAGVAHDFNNLLTAMIGFGQLLQARGSLSDNDRRFVDEIVGAGERGAELVRQLLIFSRQQPIERQILDLNTAIGNLERILRRVLREDIHLEIRTAGQPMHVLADPTEIEQVMINLAANARDAMPRGGHLTIGTSEIELDPLASQGPELEAGPYVQLTVSDTGVGMDEATVERIFEPFFTTKDVGRGTGLGLSTVFGIVRACGGAVSVESEPGHGATFQIYLPRVGLPTPATAAQPAGRESMGEGVWAGGKTILLAEDERGVRLLLRTTLESNGYSVLEAGSGEEALSRAQAHQGRIDLLLTDVVMPGMSGAALAERVVANQDRAGLKIVFMSGYTGDATAQSVLDDLRGAGAELLAKPFTPDALLRKVQELLA